MEDQTRRLVDSASRGDASAVDQLLMQHLPQLQAFVRLRMGPQLRAKEGSADLVQSTCREVLEKIDRFQYRGEDNFRRWLFTTALRKVLKRVAYYQAGKRDVQREALLDPGLDPQALLAEAYSTMSSPSQALAKKEELQEFEAAFDQLPDHYQEVITLAKVVELSHREIGEIMGRSEASTRSLLYRALSELSELMDREDS